MAVFLLFWIVVGGSVGIVAPLECSAAKIPSLPRLAFHTAASFPGNFSFTTAEESSVVKPQHLLTGGPEILMEALLGKGWTQGTASHRKETDQSLSDTLEQHETSLPSNYTLGHSEEEVAPLEVSGRGTGIRKALKKDVYRTILRETLRYQREMQHTLLQKAQKKSMTESIMKHWLTSLLDSGAAPHVLQEAARTLSGRGTLGTLAAALRKGRVKEAAQTSQLRTLLLHPTMNLLTRGRRSSAGESLGGRGRRSRATKGEETLIRQRRRRENKGGIMYIPVGGTTQTQCPTPADAAGASLSQLAFLSICLTVFNIIVNISNNINNNNNNDNLNADNSVSNNNAEVSLNVNSGAQVNVMLPPPIPGRRRGLRDTWALTTTHIPNETSFESILQEVLTKETQEEAGKTRSTTLENILQKMVTKETEKEAGNTSSTTLENILQKVMTKETQEEAGKTNRDTQVPNEKSSENILQKVLTKETQKEVRNTSSTTSENILKRRRIRSKPRSPSVTKELKERDTKDPTENATKRTSKGFNIKDASLKDAETWRILQEGGGVAVGVLRGVGRWMKEVPLSSPSCLGFTWCRGLSGDRPEDPSHLWLSALASFVMHQREGKRSSSGPSLQRFLAAAVRWRACRLLFPSCLAE